MSDNKDKNKSATKKRTRRILAYHEPLFSKKSVDETRCALLKLLKLTCTRLGITNQDFGAKHQDWYTAGNGKGSKSPLHTSLNNFRGVMISTSTITYEYWQRIMYGVLNLDIVNLSVTFHHPITKDIITISSDNTYDDQKKLYDEETKKAKLIS